MSVELLAQGAESGLAHGDPLSWGRLRLTLAGVEIWNGTANLTSTALCLLRTTRSDFAGPLGGVSDSNPLIHHCGLLPEMGCPIGASWRVRHVAGDVHIDTVVRACEEGADEEIELGAAPLVIDRVVYTDRIRAFAIAVRDGLDREAGRYRDAADPGLAPLFAAFWSEYALLLGGRDLITTALTAARIEAALASAESGAAEATPGIVVVRVCTPHESAALIARARGALWNPATINADRSIDRSVREADVLDEAAHADVIEDARARLGAAADELAAELAPGSVLAEVQFVRYHPGGRYLDHRDSPALGASPRALSLVWYLNDDFTGGETRFVSPDVLVSPVSGVAILFSPILMHRAEPVVARTKYVVVAWYHERSNRP